jgi:hypothetical protein
LLEGVSEANRYTLLSTHQRIEGSHREYPDWRRSEGLLTRQGWQRDRTRVLLESEQGQRRPSGLFDYYIPDDGIYLFDVRADNFWTVEISDSE